VDDWVEVNRRTPRLVSVLPNGPIDHPTVRVFLAGGVPEVMLHLRELGLLDTSVLTVTGQSLAASLDEWRTSQRRLRFRALLQDKDGVNPDEVILSPSTARQKGLKPTAAFPRGNVAPEGAVIKSAAIDPTQIDASGVYLLEGPARVFTC
jgi:dihydroxyacid dehydratase/phosphogluconate dehydratase